MQALPKGRSKSRISVRHNRRVAYALQGPLTNRQVNEKVISSIIAQARATHRLVLPELVIVEANRFEMNALDIDTLKLAQSCQFRLRDRLDSEDDLMAPERLEIEFRLSESVPVRTVQIRFLDAPTRAGDKTQRLPRRLADVHETPAGPDRFAWRAPDHIPPELRSNPAAESEFRRSRDAQVRRGDKTRCNPAVPAQPRARGGDPTRRLTTLAISVFGQPDTEIFLEGDGLWTLGRRPDCDVVVLHNTISAQHCVFVRKGPTLTIQNTSQSNPILIVGRHQSEAPTPIDEGDAIQLSADVLVRVIQSGGAASGHTHG